MFNGCYSFVNDFAMDNYKQVWDLSCEDLCCECHLQMKQEYDKAHESNGHLGFHGDSSASGEKVYDKGDEN